MTGSGSYKPGKSRKVELRKIITEKEISIVDDYCGFKEKFPRLSGLVNLFVKKNNLPPIQSKLRSSDFDSETIIELPSLLVVYGGNAREDFHFIAYTGLFVPCVQMRAKEESGSYHHLDTISLEYILQGKINQEPVHLRYDVGASVLFRYINSEKIASSKARLEEERKDSSNYWFGM